ncbi:hypothetical protein ANO11243_035730 [Dothideomycetidae sp. 11243]|nr:hypothetical protein ANO11243_035730 [fungal sp. No.11243]
MPLLSCAVALLEDGENQSDTPAPYMGLSSAGPGGGASAREGQGPQAPPLAAIRWASSQSASIRQGPRRSDQATAAHHRAGQPYNPTIRSSNADLAARSHDRSMIAYLPLPYRVAGESAAAKANDLRRGRRCFVLG